MIILFIIGVLVVAVSLAGASRNRQRRAAADALTALQRAAYHEGVRDALDAVTAGAAASSLPTEADAPARGLSRDDFRARYRKALPEATRKHGYWRVPPVEIATDDEIRVALARAHPAPRIVFTGWTDAEKAALIEAAHAADFRVMAVGSVQLTLLCCGENPGPVKIAKARKCHAAIISGAQFERLAAYDWPEIPTLEEQSTDV